MAAEPADQPAPAISPEDDAYYAEHARAYIGGLLGARSRASGLSIGDGYLRSRFLDYLDPRHEAVLRTLELLSADGRLPWSGLLLGVGRHVVGPALLRFKVAGDLPAGVNPVVAAAGYGDYLRTARDHGLLDRADWGPLTPLSQARLEATAMVVVDGCLRHRMLDAADAIERLTVPDATFDPAGVREALRPVSAALHEHGRLEFAHRGMTSSGRIELPEEQRSLREHAARLGRSLRDVAAWGIERIGRNEIAERDIRVYQRLAELAEGRESGRGRPRSVDAAARGFEVPAGQEEGEPRPPEQAGEGPGRTQPHRPRFERHSRRRRPRGNDGPNGGPGVG